MAKRKDSWAPKLCRSGIGKWCGGHGRVIRFIQKNCKHVCKKLGSGKWLGVGIARPFDKSSEQFFELCVLLEHYVVALAQVSWEFWPFIHLFLCHMRAGSFPVRLTRKISRQGRNMSRLARNCPILTGGKIWNWQKLASECRKCGRPIWCIVVWNLNAPSHLLQVFWSISFPFLHLHVLSKSNRSPIHLKFAFLRGVSFTLSLLWLISKQSVNVAERPPPPLLPPVALLPPSLVMTSQSGPTKKGRCVEKADKYNHVFCKLWKVL